MAAILGGTFLLTALVGWKAGNARADVALMGGSGAAFGGLSLLLFGL
jgi:hypothetical protein